MTYIAQNQLFYIQLNYNALHISWWHKNTSSLWWGKNNPDKVKEIITDDDRFTSYLLEQYEN